MLFSQREFKDFQYIDLYTSPITWVAHVENAGFHSGDATLILPAQKLYIETTKKIRKVSKKI